MVPFLNLDELVDDRASEGIFRVKRDVFTDAAIFEAELEHVFENTWLFLGLESQIAKPNDYLTTYMGRQPVLLSRNAKNEIGCFLNTCRHRGAVICPYKQGNARAHVCRYHGWTYDSGGKSLGVSQAKDGQYAPHFLGQDHDLVPIARLANYRGLIFGSLSPDVPSIEEHLGEAKLFIDLIVDQSPRGLEVVPGTVNYTFDGNWKLQFENGLDFYHFASTHAAYVDVVKERERAGLASSGSYEAPEMEEATGTYTFPRGHAVMYSVRQNLTQFQRPLARDPAVMDEVRGRVGPVLAQWMLRHRNLTIYPNLQIIDIQSIQFRTWRPLAPNKTEITSRCVAPIGEDDDTRAMRIRNYEDFFNPTGLGSSDDNLMFEYVQTGYEASAGGQTQGYDRGMGPKIIDRDPFLSELAISPTSWAYGPPSFGDETGFHSGYREWKRLMETGQSRRNATREAAR